jgi:hypothetical protein
LGFEDSASSSWGRLGAMVGIGDLSMPSMFSINYLRYLYFVLVGEAKRIARAPTATRLAGIVGAVPGSRAITEPAGDQ